MSVNDRDIPVYGEYDVIVSGGGIIGVISAAAMAKAGKKVALVERRSLLGWEIGQARRLFAAIPSELTLSPYIQQLLDVLAEWPQRIEAVHAPVSELTFDKWLMEAGVDVLLNGWSTKVIEANGVVKGLVVGTREGYRYMLAPIVVETDEYGRLIDSGYEKTPLFPPVIRSMILSQISLAESVHWAFPDGRQLFVRPMSGNMCRADITLQDKDIAVRDREFHAAILETIESIRQRVEGGGQAQVCYLADEEWRMPSFQLQQGFMNRDWPVGRLLANPAMENVEIRACDLALSRIEGLLFAGPWLPCYIKASSDAEDIAIVNRFLLGEAVASLIVHHTPLDHSLSAMK